MTTAVQRRRGTTTEHASFTGLEGEISVNTTKDTLVVHDGSTAGGFELARADGSNFVATSVDINGGTIDGTTIGASSASTGAFTTLSASGEITANGGIALGDNDKATFGASDDLQIYHDGSNSYVRDTGTGNLNISADQLQILNAANSEIKAGFTTDGAVDLYHNNVLKLATTATGIDVTGTATMDGLTVTGTLGNFAVDTQGAVATFSRPSTSYIRASDVSGSLRFDAGGSLARLNIAANGDISFYEDTGTTAKLFWDASAEKLNLTGVGGLDVTGTATMDGLDVRTISSPARIKVQRDDNTNSVDSASIDLLEGTGINADFGALGSFGYRLEVDGSTNKFNIKSGNGASVANRLSVERDTGDISFYEDTGTTAKLFWDASLESLGVGITPATAMHVYQATGNTALRVESSAANSQAQINFKNDARRYNVGINSSDNLVFEDDTAASTRMIIDSAGNVLVGKTAVSSATVGFQAGQDGFVAATRASGQPLVLNRTTTDGIIADFRKDGATVGSIGTEAGTSFIDGHATASGMRFDTFGVLPRKSGAIANNSVDLGSATTAWQDLYLSGGVYLGGTGPANHLDDYEEGTWTPVFKRNGSTNNATIVFQDAKYVKSGRQVTVTVYVTSIDYSLVTDGTFAEIKGLPFTTSGWHSGSIGYGGATNVSETTWVLNNVTANFLSASGNGFYSGNPDLNRGMFTITYITT